MPMPRSRIHILIAAGFLSRLPRYSHRDGLADPAITWLAELVTKAFLSEAADGHH